MSVRRSIGSRSLAVAVAVAWAFALAASLAIGEARAQAAPTAAQSATPTIATTTTSPTTVVATAVPAQPASPFASMVQGLVGLVIVVGLIYGVAWFLKRVGPRTRASGIVQVLGGASVGPREKVVVVRFGGETLLIGVAPGQVSLLHTAVDNGEVADGPTPSVSPRFIDRLRAARSGT